MTAPGNPPIAGTVERWAWDLVAGASWSAKLRPPPVPDAWEVDPPARRPRAPGRPAELRVVPRSPRTPRPGALARPEARARLVAALAHHELQAAELFAWGLLAFPAAPRAFRRGLLRLALDELRHLREYAEHLRACGSALGEHPVRDWFWERVPRCRSPLELVALLGLGLEGANLDHSARWAEHLRAAGDDAGAALLERIGREEVAHVRFAARWFRRLDPVGAASLDFDAWAARLVPPLTPALLRGRPLARELRARAGLGPEFLDRLDACRLEPSGS